MTRLASYPTCNSDWGYTQCQLRDKSERCYPCYGLWINVLNLYTVYYYSFNNFNIMDKEEV